MIELFVPKNMQNSRKKKRRLRVLECVIEVLWEWPKAWCMTLYHLALSGGSFLLQLVFKGKDMVGHTLSVLLRFLH